jgi:single stranded DNA-binding protein
METDMPSISINRVVLVGRLTRDPDLRSLPNGTSACQLRVACSSVTKDTPSGEYRERSNFFDVSAYAGAADSAARYLRKGSRVAIDGRLQWREWQAADGQRRQTIKIVADIVQFLDGSGPRRPDRDRSLADETAHEPANETGHATAPYGNDHVHYGHEGARHDDAGRGESSRVDGSDGSAFDAGADTDVDVELDSGIGTDTDTDTDIQPDVDSGAGTDVGPVPGMALVF